MRERIIPERADDEPPERPGDPPCSCLDGHVFIGCMVAGEDGVEVEVFEVVRCRRCEEK